MSDVKFNLIEEAIDDIRNGKMVIVVDDAGMPVHEAIRRADEYLYQAKHAGRNCVRSAPVQPRHTSV